MQLPSIFCSCREVVALTVAIHSQHPWNPWRTFPLRLRGRLKGCQGEQRLRGDLGAKWKGWRWGRWVVQCLFVLFRFVFVRVFVLVFMFVCVFVLVLVLVFVSVFCFVFVSVYVSGFCFCMMMMMMLLLLRWLLFFLMSGMMWKDIWLLIGRLDVVWNTV